MSKDVIRGASVIVLGMHRSGTSSVAGACVRLGLTPPRTLLPAAPDNPTGFYESAYVNAVNDLILREAGFDWSDCLAFDPARFDTSARAALASMTAGVLQQEFGGAEAIVLKDPRLCVTLPLWLPALRRNKAALSVLLVLRHPAAVARSLARRDGMAPDRAVGLWLHHMVEAERVSRAIPRAVICYEQMLAGWRATLDRAGRLAGITWPEWDGGPRPDIDQFLRPADRAPLAEPPEGDRLMALAASVWRCLRMLHQDPMDVAAMWRLDEARVNLAEIRDAHGVRVARAA